RDHSETVRADAHRVSLQRTKPVEKGLHDMRKLVLLLSASALIVAGAAVAKTVTVTITKAGYVPKDVTVDQGDTVQFTNGDTIAHQITFTSSTVVASTPNPLIVPPTTSVPSPFQSA